MLLTKGGLSGALMHGDASAVEYPGDCSDHELQIAMSLTATGVKIL